jgi:hypothetical protein
MYYLGGGADGFSGDEADLVVGEERLERPRRLLDADRHAQVRADRPDADLIDVDGDDRAGDDAPAN